MAVAQLPLQYNIESDEDLQTRLCTKGFKVVEVYSTWCGPCRSVLPTFKRLRQEKDDEAALLFITVPAEKCEYLDAARDHRGKSEPLFLMYRNGTLKARIHGANLPQLVSSTADLTPNNPEMDDLEENPLYVARSKAGALGGGGAAQKAAGKAKK